MNETIPFVVFSSCLTVRGATRSLICDLQRESFHFIPNGLFDILKNYNKHTINEVKQNYRALDFEFINEYFDFLHKEEYIFFSSNPDYFPDLDLRWDAPATITNSLLDVDEKINLLRCSKFIFELNELGCRYIQIRCFNKLNNEILTSLLMIFEGSIIESIELVLPDDTLLNVKTLKSLVNKFSRITSVYVYSTIIAKEDYIAPNGHGNIFFLNQGIKLNHCGIISPHSFYINIENFTESHHHNSCLNRKISIDTEGNIKNCPSMPESFGNIKDTTLQEAIEKPGFKKYWDITKDKIHVCKDCEFRYICTDCRAYIEDPEDIYSKPLKCGYDPYSGEWKNWKSDLFKLEKMKFYYE